MVFVLATVHHTQLLGNAFSIGYWLTPSTKYNQHFLLVLLRDHNICNTIIHNYWLLRLLARTLLWPETTIYHDTTTLSICGRNLCCQWGAMSVVYVFDLLYPLHGSIVHYQAEDEEWMYSHSCTSRMECIEKYNTLYNCMQEVRHQASHSLLARQISTTNVQCGVLVLHILWSLKKTRRNIFSA